MFNRSCRCEEGRGVMPRPPLPVGGEVRAGQKKARRRSVSLFRQASTAGSREGWRGRRKSRFGLSHKVSVAVNTLPF